MKILLIIPAYNEENCITKVIDELVERYPQYDYIIVNDGSTDHTSEICHKSGYEIIDLPINLGLAGAFQTGLKYAYLKNYDYAMQMDADGQHLPEYIEALIKKINEGYDIVYGVKISRDADSFMKRNTALVFYKLQRSLGVKAIHNHADFRLMSRRALEQLSHFKERNLYLRGLVPLIGYKSTTVDDAISERTAGKSKYTLKKMLALAMDGITSFSTKPISLILGAGFFFLFISIVMTVYILLSYWEHATVPGWTSMMLSLWFIGSIVLLAIGVIGQYIGKIYIEVKNRPLYNIETLLCDKKSKLQDTSSK